MDQEQINREYERLTEADLEKAEWLVQAIGYMWHLELVDQNGKRVAFRANDCQWALLKLMVVLAAHEIPIRISVLKDRQRGFSTVINLLFLALCETLPTVRALVMAQEVPASGNLWQRVDFAHQWDATAKKTQFSSKRELLFLSPHSSHFKVLTATETVARSDTIQFLHESEVAEYSNQDKTIASAEATVKDVPRTIIIRESTGNGPGDMFEQTWTRADKANRERRDDLNQWHAVFHGWLDDAEYTRPIPADVELGQYTPEEDRLAAIGATPEHIYWRRCKLQAAPDENEFAQNYPACPVDAFRSTGRPGIPVEIIARHRQTVKPGRRARFEYIDRERHVVRAVFNEDYHANYWTIWETPNEEADYVAFADVAEGEVSDLKNPASDPDESAIVVWNRQTRAQAAEWHGYIAPDVLGAELVKASWWYNDCWYSPEVNACGAATILVCKRQKRRRLFIRLAATTSTDERDEQNVYGWRTTEENRNEMIDGWIAGCRAGEGGDWRESIIVRSAALLDQEQTFVAKKGGRREHRSGKHDDVLFAGMGAWQLHLRCPRTRFLPRALPGPDERNIVALSLAGATDPLAERMQREVAEFEAKMRKQHHG